LLTEKLDGFERKEGGRGSTCQGEITRTRGKRKSLRQFLAWEKKKKKKGEKAQLQQKTAFGARVEGGRGEKDAVSIE